ncbi:extensin family protein [Sphingomonas sp. So64.6b]|uniref:extensin family protein n=1 Tax=Sphingomonas sp. So64.6b TaxID=2997354 RepID=UPI0016001C9E|nr:extensin family protein [Sphingomonas sp. So64.6b]QNA85582.1 extensin family protein [Sphingomonas sp. So64.6b]
MPSVGRCVLAAFSKPRYRGRVKRALLLILPLLLSGCLFGGGDDDRPPPRRAGSRPATLNMPTSSETRACYADLARDNIQYSPLPDHDFGGGCKVVGAVQLIDIGLPVTNLKAMRCGLARAFTGWARNGVAPAARQILGSDLVRIETFGTYVCRNIVGSAGNSGKLSGHGIANAVDISAFILSDGRRISIEQGWRSNDRDVKTFLRTIQTSACKRFGTVLSPDYNAVHYNHLHLEADKAKFCR